MRINIYSNNCREGFFIIINMKDYNYKMIELVHK
jgi:hypothetical protein